MGALMIAIKRLSLQEKMSKGAWEDNGTKHFLKYAYLRLRLR
jgi:hypothetical protein